MDQAKDSIAAGQGFFLSKLIRPLAEPLCELLDPAAGELILERLNTNKQHWEELLERHGRKTAAALVDLA